MANPAPFAHHALNLTHGTGSGRDMERITGNAIGRDDHVYFVAPRVNTTSGEIGGGTTSHVASDERSHKSPSDSQANVRHLSLHHEMSQTLWAMDSKRTDSCPSLRTYRLRNGLSTNVPASPGGGNALIHGPSLVAWPVVSEWRTRCPLALIPSTNQGASQ
jgi:hypothetical protein